MIQSLRLRVFLIYILFVILFIGWLSFYSYQSVAKTELDTGLIYLASNAGQIAEEIKPLISPFPNPKEIETILGNHTTIWDINITLVLNNGITYAVDSDDPTVSENQLNSNEVALILIEQPVREIRQSIENSQDIFYIQEPIIVGDEISGAVILSGPLSRIQNKSISFRNTLLLISGFASLLAVLFVVILINYVIGPLEKLAISVKTYSKSPKFGSLLSEETNENDELNHTFIMLTDQLNSQINELQSERETLAAVMANITDGIVIVDGDGNIQMINPSAQKLFNATEMEALDRSLIEVVRNHRVVEIWEKCQASIKQEVTSYETSGERNFIQAIASPLKHSFPGGVLLVFQDLTRMRRLEIIRRDFVSNVSHELRTPLASLRALAETLNEGALEDPPAARRFLLRMEGEIDNLTQMVEELLELSRIESGRVPLQRETLDPCKLLQSAVDRMQLQAERAGLNIYPECEDDLSTIYVDRIRMEQVIINLLHNAIKFTLPNGEIHLSAFQEGNVITLSMSDTGVGIAAEDLNRIFERFYKVDRARSGRGTGLGLSIARHLVEAHGGSIWAESETGKGSTFFISLPTT